MDKIIQFIYNWDKFDATYFDLDMINNNNCFSLKHIWNQIET